MTHTDLSIRARAAIAGAVLVTAFSATSSALAADAARPKGFVAELVGMSSDDARFNFVEDQIAKCMADAGLAYTREQPPKETPDTRENRATNGFGMSIADASGAAAAPAALTTLGLVAPAERSRFYSEFARCYGAGLRAAATKLEEAAAALPVALHDEIVSVSTMTHPVVAAAVTRWSGCLKAKGFTYSHPLEMLNDVQASAKQLGASPAAQDLDRVQARERALAVADWDCTRQSDPGPALAGVLADLETRAAAAGAPASPYHE